MPKMLAGESLVLPPLHRHWVWLAKDLVIPTIGLVVLLAVLDWLGVAFVPPDLRVLSTLILLAAGGLWGVVVWLQWNAASLTVTDQRVILEEGIFQKTSKVMPLDRVQDVSTKQTLLGRMLDYGLVEIDVAGSSEVFPYVRSPEMLRDQVFVLSEQLRRGL
jgi:membrane protein YdbS with pleckstrin-like domain